MGFKKYICIICTLFSSFFGLGQNLLLKFNHKNTDDKPILDSISFVEKHQNAKSVFQEITVLQKKLSSLGFFNHSIIGKPKPNDSVFLFEIDLKNRITKLHIYIDKKSDVLNSAINQKKDNYKIIPVEKAEAFLQDLTNKIESKGYSQVKIDLTDLYSKNDTLFASLKIDFGTQRKVNDLVIVGYDKFPAGIKKNILRNYRNKTFSAENLEKINAAFNGFNFFSQTKYPEILFSKDSTKVYVYVEKTKANRFDGLIGFANDKNAKLIFNGYLDLMLVNTINAGENFNLNWKSDGNQQTTFNIGLEIPYVFKTKMIVKGNLHIFKQDSIFQNTKTFLDLGYALNHRSKIFVGMQNIESTNIQTINAAVPNFETQYTTIQFEHSKTLDRENPFYLLFPEKSKINLKTGVGSRKTIIEKTNQFFCGLEAFHNFYFREKISFNLRSQNYLLQSSSYFANELYRFGGINSIRGFNENSLQANLAATILTELRYAVTPKLYVYTVADYGYIEDQTTNTSGSLTGFGAGFGLLSKGGIFNLIYANGSSTGQKTVLGNSIVHLSFKVGF